MLDEYRHRHLGVIGRRETREPAVCRQVLICIERALELSRTRLAGQAHTRNLEPLQPWACLKSPLHGIAHDREVGLINRYGPTLGRRKQLLEHIALGVELRFGQVRLVQHAAVSNRVGRVGDL